MSNISRDVKIRKKTTIVLSNADLRSLIADACAAKGWLPLGVSKADVSFEDEYGDSFCVGVHVSWTETEERSE